ncbi:tetratricopeptide repeat protein [Reichenbachiella sp. MALMAid0571]|uniref:tetratricopeptide repeat protein n=1 Tax=Reichenbachiella sp. MALMAid0571 TaxID=3143939 RepID=UPI0032E03896
MNLKKLYKSRFFGQFWVILIVLSFTFSPLVGQKRKRGDKKETIDKKTEKNEEQLIDIDNNFIEAEKYFLLKDYDKSSEYFDKVLEVDPENAAANYKKAQILSEKEENTEALPFAVRAKQLNPKNKYYYILLANIYTNIADLEMAAATYFDLIENVENSENYLFDLAALQLYQKKYDNALETYTRAQKYFGAMEEIIFQKQKIYLRQNRLDLAIKEGEELINNNPGKSLYVASLAKMLISNDKPEKAQSYLEKYVEEYGDDPVIGVQLAEIYRKAGKVKEAIMVLKSAFLSPSMDINAKISTLSGYISMLPNEELVEPLIGLTKGLVTTHPDSFQGYVVAGDLYYNTGRKELARENYLKAIEINSSNFNVWQNVINIELDLQEYKSAVKHSEKALEYFPNQGSLYYFAGTAQMLIKDYKEAIELFKIGRTYTSGNKQLSSVMNGQLGDAYNSIGDHKNSDLAYDEALKLNPENDHVLNNYSYFLSLRKEKLDIAESMSSKLISLREDSPTYLDTHGWVLYIRKKYKEARVFLEKAAKAENNATIIEHYGDVLFQLGEVNEAIIQWEKARDLTDDKENLNKKIADKQLYE